MIDFWLYGSGVGTVTVSVPYAMQAVCTTQGIRDTASSSAGVWLEDGPGVRANGFQSANLGCGSGAELSGVLTVSRDVDTAYGPLLDFMAGTQTMAFATVPDLAPTCALMALGLLGIGLLTLTMNQQHARTRAETFTTLAEARHRDIALERLRGRGTEEYIEDRQRDGAEFQ
jgi:hypothetical protein